MQNINIFKTINKYIDEAPVNVEAITDDLGIMLVYDDSLEDQISGMIEKDQNSNYKITINANHALTRQRFTLAHEIGHYIYHRDIMGEGIDDNKAYRSQNVGKYKNSQIGRREETQANEFAANLLMPWSLISTLQEMGVNTPEKLAKKLEVSEQAMKIRLGLR